MQGFVSLVTGPQLPSWAACARKEMFESLKRGATGAEFLVNCCTHLHQYFHDTKCYMRSQGAGAAAHVELRGSVVPVLEEMPKWAVLRETLEVRAHTL